MVAESPHVDGGVLDFVLTDVPDVVKAPVGTSVETLNHSVVFIDAVLE